MKNYPPADLRNFAIVGHASSGKTMLAEAMLRCGGVIQRMGRIAEGSTVSDYHVSEKNRQISVSAISRSSSFTRSTASASAPTAPGITPPITASRK